jgi:copper chaperone NosL
MMAGRLPVLALAGALALGGCDEEAPMAEAPPPREMSGEEIGHYCGMLVAEHPGPKGQIFLTGEDQPVWFTSVRDAFAFTMLPEEPREIVAIYVNDMGRAASWDAPGPGTWIEAHDAHFVIGSARRGGMGVEEVVPFADAEAARRFAEEHGGEVVGFSAVPQDYVLGATAEPEPAPEPHEGATP